MGDVAFLTSSEKIQKKRYVCRGAKVCVKAPHDFRNAVHSTEVETGELMAQVRKLTPQQNSEEITWRRAINVYLSFSKEGRKYCRFVGKCKESTGSSALGGAECEGGPILRTNSETGKLFIGCSGYRRGFTEHAPGVPFTSGKHFSRTMDDLGEKGREAMIQMLETGKALEIEGETCYYVAQRI